MENSFARVLVIFHCFSFCVPVIVSIVNAVFLKVLFLIAHYWYAE